MRDTRSSGKRSVSGEQRCLHEERGEAVGHEWLRVEGEDTSWTVDASFLRSNWTCIWNEGCAGIEREADVDAQLGCCSVGAQFLDEDEAMLIAALGSTLSPEDAQFAGEIAENGALSDDRKNTRLVEGACIFLNRPGFSGGAGCSLHGEALREGDSPLYWKPSVCWQLPVKVERSEAADGGSQATIRAWSRADWGPDGETMAYCCTERGGVADAFVGQEPVVESLREELAALMGDEVVNQIAAMLGQAQ